MFIVVEEMPQYDLVKSRDRTLLVFTSSFSFKLFVFEEIYNDWERFVSSPITFTLPCPIFHLRKKTRTLLWTEMSVYLSSKRNREAWVRYMFMQDREISFVYIYCNKEKDRLEKIYRIGRANRPSNRCNYIYVNSRHMLEISLRKVFFCWDMIC